jgi:hypothetical protein
MSKIIVGAIRSANANTAITVASGSNIYLPGSCVQIATVRSDNRTTYNAPNSGGGTTITDLNLTITPKNANSMLLITWMISGETNENVNFLVHRNGALITDSNYEGFNNMAGNTTLQSGYTTSWYDTDVNSTPATFYIRYQIPAGNTSSRTYAPAVRSSSNGGSYTFFMNRTAGSQGQDSYENGISNGIVMEIGG